MLLPENNRSQGLERAGEGRIRERMCTGRAAAAGSLERRVRLEIIAAAGCAGASVERELMS